MKASEGQYIHVFGPKLLRCNSSRSVEMLLHPLRASEMVRFDDDR